jgi:MFS family permease
MNSSGKSIPRNVVILGIVSLLTDTATEMIYPLLPLFVATLGSGAVLLGIIEGIAETTASLLKLVSGIISDRVGKRKALVVVGYAISSLVRPLTGIVTDARQIVAIRMTDRIGKGIRTSPRDALIASSIDESIRGKAYGFHRAMDHAGAVLGPIVCLGTIAVLILVVNLDGLPVILRATFLVSLIPGLLAVVTLLAFVKENTAGMSPASRVALSFHSFDGNFKIYLGIAALFTLGNSSDAFMLFRIQEAMLKSATLSSVMTSFPLFRAMVERFGDPQTRTEVANVLFLPLVWSFFHIVKVILSTPLGALSDRIGRKIVISVGWGIYAVVYAGFALLDRLPEHWQIAAAIILFGVYAVYYAFTEGAEKAFVADMVPSHVRGSAFGVFNFSVGVAALPASVVFGILYQSFGGAVAFGSGAAIALLAMILLSTMVAEQKRP